MNVIALILVICSSIEWNIKDSTARQYVTQEELSALIEHTNLNPIGKNVDDVMAHAIETCVQNHPMVRHAECYITSRGKVKINLTQRVPILGVKTEGVSYYIDSDRQRMPSSKRVTTPVIWAVGKVDEQQAQTVLADIVEWLAKNTYWENRIEKIEVTNKDNLALVDTTGLKILIGNGQEFDKKMYKLRVFEEQMSKVEGKAYKAIDLRYKDQVIGKE